MEADKKGLVNKLIKDYRDGKASALEELMFLTYKDLFLIAYSYLKDKMLAEDAVSETFISLIKKIHTVTNEENLNGYLRTIVINKSLDTLRKRKKEFFPGDEYINTLPDKDNVHKLRLVLESLEPAQREVLLLWQYKYTLKEICEKTGLTINQARLMLKKAQDAFIENYHKITAAGRYKL